MLFQLNVSVGVNRVFIVSMQCINIGVNRVFIVSMQRINIGVNRVFISRGLVACEQSSPHFITYEIPRTKRYLG